MTNNISAQLMDIMLMAWNKSEKITQEEKEKLKQLGITSEADLAAYKAKMSSLKAEGAAERQSVLTMCQPIIDKMLKKAGNGNEYLVGQAIIAALNSLPEISKSQDLLDALNNAEANFKVPTQTPEEKKQAVDGIIKDFITGNMTQSQAKQELEKLGIIKCDVSDNTNNRVLEFTFDNEKYHIECSKIAADDGKGGKIVSNIDPKKVEEIVQTYGNDAKKYFTEIAKAGDKVIAYTYNLENWPAGVLKTIAAIKKYLSTPVETEAEKALNKFIQDFVNGTTVEDKDFENLKNLIKEAGITPTETSANNGERNIITFPFKGKTYRFETNSGVPNELKEAVEQGFDNFDEFQSFIGNLKGAEILKGTSDNVKNSTLEMTIKYRNKNYSIVIDNAGTGSARKAAELGYLPEEFLFNDFGISDIYEGFLGNDKQALQTGRTDGGALHLTDSEGIENNQVGTTLYNAVMTTVYESLHDSDSALEKQYNWDNIIQNIWNELADKYAGKQISYDTFVNEFMNELSKRIKENKLGEVSAKEPEYANNNKLFTNPDEAKEEITKIINNNRNQLYSYYQSVGGKSDFMKYGIVQILNYLHEQISGNGPFKVNDEDIVNKAKTYIDDQFKVKSYESKTWTEFYIYSIINEHGSELEDYYKTHGGSKYTEFPYSGIILGTSILSATREQFDGKLEFSDNEVVEAAKRYLDTIIQEEIKSRAKKYNTPDEAKNAITTIINNNRNQLYSYYQSVGGKGDFMKDDIVQVLNYLHGQISGNGPFEVSTEDIVNKAKTYIDDLFKVNSYETQEKANSQVSYIIIKYIDQLTDYYKAHGGSESTVLGTGILSAAREQFDGKLEFSNNEIIDKCKEILDNIISTEKGQNANAKETPDNNSKIEQYTTPAEAKEAITKIINNNRNQLYSYYQSKGGKSDFMQYGIGQILNYLHGRITGDGPFEVNTDEIVQKAKEFIDNNLLNPAVTTPPAQPTPPASDTSALTKEQLQNTYHLTDQDIAIFFKENNGVYEINNDAVRTCFGKEVNNVQELMDAMSGGFAIGYVYGAYSMSDPKYTQYMIRISNGSGNDVKYIKLDTTKIAEDFPGRQITTLGQLKEAVDKKAQTPVPDVQTPPASGAITDADKTTILNQVKTDAVSGGIDGIKLTDEEAATLLRKLNEDSDIKNFTGTKEQFTTLVNEKAKTYAKEIVTARTPQGGAGNATGASGADEAGAAKSTDGTGSADGASGADGAKSVSLDEFANTFSNEAERTNVKSDIKTLEDDIKNNDFGWLSNVADYGIQISLSKNDNNFVLSLKHGDAKYDITFPYDSETEELLMLEGYYVPSDDGTLDKLNLYTVRTCDSFQELADLFGGEDKIKDYITRAKATGNAYTLTVKYNNNTYDIKLASTRQNKDALIKAGLITDEVTNDERTDIFKKIADEAKSSGINGTKLTDAQASTLREKLQSDSELRNFKGNATDFESKARERATVIVTQILADETAKKPKNAAQNAIMAIVNNSHALAKDRITSTISAIEANYAAENNQKTKVNTSYSIDANGNISFEKGSYAETMYNDLFDHIKEVVGTDGFDEKTLKSLYQTAWQMTYSSYPSNQENDISAFLNKVYDNFKEVLRKIKDKPEYLDIFTGKTANGNTRAVNGAKQETGGGDVRCDKTANIYADGSVHVSNDISDANLQKTVSTLKSKLQSLYPNIPQSTLNSLINDAVKKAVENIGNGKTEEIPKNFAISGNQTNASTIANLALYYFEQALYNSALTDDKLLNGNPAEATSTATTVTDEEKAKWTKAKDSINDSLDLILKNGNYITGFLVKHGISGNRATNMYISGTGDLKFNNTDVQKAYDDLFNEIWSDKNIKGITITEFKAIYRAAWINTYNGIDNMSYNNMETVFERVVKNIKNIMNKLATNPEYMTIINNASNVAKSVTDSKTEINYGGTDINLDYGDGNVHLHDDNSDKEYQVAIKTLRTTLKNNYVPPMSESQFNTWFTQAQKIAIKVCAGASNDYLFGMERRYIGDIMHLITYQFDKLMYKGIFGAE